MILKKTPAKTSHVPAVSSCPLEARCLVIDINNKVMISEERCKQANGQFKKQHKHGKCLVNNASKCVTYSKSIDYSQGNYSVISIERSSDLLLSFCTEEFVLKHAVVKTTEQRPRSHRTMLRLRFLIFGAISLRSTTLKSEAFPEGATIRSINFT